MISGCPALIQAFGNVAATEIEDRTMVLLRAVGPAVAACNCQLDIPAVRSVLWAIAGNPHPTTALVVRLDKAMPLDLPGATPWREANKKLGAKTTSVWPGVK